MVEGDRDRNWHVGARPSTIVALLFAITMQPIAGRANAFEVLATAPLTMTDVENIISAAATRAKHDGVAAVIAVSDREGHPLGVCDMTDAPTISDDIDIINQTVLPPHLSQVEATALEKARTAAFLSSDQDAFSTLTADTLTPTHFPLGISTP